MNPGEIVISGQLAAAIPLALLAGLVSFASPCVLPLVPGYLGYVSGMSNGPRSKEGPARSRVVLGALLFVLGFSLIFVLIGAFAGTVGAFLVQWQEIITRVLGVVVILMGLVFVGQFSFLQRTVKSSFRPATGLAGAPLLGIVFAIGWAPCIGPTLIAIQALSLTSGSTGRGALLGLFYCLGLGIPFLLVAAGFDRVTGSIAFLKRHIRAINVGGGILLILVGLFMVSGLWGILMSRIGVLVQGYVTTI
ncbi:cytochrome c biogenesis protein CcdA [Mycetocola manganoxydans]|uniref:Cytochrome c biogenesis protein CcdA n=1 Tax=Mycetocola manganoxydans TaxID=699879 RepID=A0A3L6ZW92_9MICO|nr:cytochrome c biogenesis protein CcdA [Mycetocola manganoxydans]RLP71372.1 cytochrome c biogenesis protein CcdA [Mycetocola manganoxydans]GHD46081.1 cytochrome C biogenesis protein CcdA [Mycetocola manganoxydans]